MSKAGRTNTYEKRKLVLKIPPGATTTLRRALWVMMKSDGRRLGRDKVVRPVNEISTTIIRQVILPLQ
jgi:hypothetical protein